MRSTPHLIPAVAVTALSAALAAQSTHVIPSGYATAEAPTSMAFLGATGLQRNQTLIAPSHLATLVGRRIVALHLRRDGDDRDPFPATTVDLEVRLSTPDHAPSLARPRFADNHDPSDVAVAFKGRIALPSAPPPPPGQGSWSQDRSVRIGLVPWVYSGGTLCVDVRGDAVGQRNWWMVDAAVDPVTGQVREVQAECNRIWNNGTSLAIPPRELVPGNTLQVWDIGNPGAAGVMLIGSGLLQVPIDLGFVGASGCKLHVLPLVTVPIAYSGADPYAGHGSAGLRLHLPADQNLLGARFATQIVGLTTRIDVSDAVEATLAGRLPSLGMSTVYAWSDAARTALPPAGEVLHGVGPVLGLEVR